MQPDEKTDSADYDFGFWPEITGVFLTIFVLWFLIYFSTGIM